MRGRFWVITRAGLCRWGSAALLVGLLVLGTIFSHDVRSVRSRVSPASTVLALVPLTKQAPVFVAPGAKGKLALAVNIDWGEEYIPGMLKVLSDLGAKATFFPTGTWAERYPDLVKDIAASGNELGSHGGRHAHPKQMSNEQIAELITSGAEIIERLTGEKPTLFAPPFGEYDQRIVRVAASLGYYTTMWTLDTIDWQKPSVATILQRILPRAKDGAIILMHPTANTLTALPVLIEALQRRGYQFVTISSLIAAHQQATRPKPPPPVPDVGAPDLEEAPGSQA